MRRMLTDPGELIECNHEIQGLNTIIYVPIKELNELPVSFELFLPNLNASAIVAVWLNNTDYELRGGGSYIDTNGPGYIVSVYPNTDSLVTPDHPYLELYAYFLKGEIKQAPIDNESHVFVRNIIHLSKINFE